MAAFAVMSKAVGNDLLKDANHSRFGFMVNQIVNLVVAVNHCPSISWLSQRISQEFHNIVVMRYLSDRTFRVYVDCFGLRRRYGAEGPNLTAIEA